MNTLFHIEERALSLQANNCHLRGKGREGKEGRCRGKEGRVKWGIRASCGVVYPEEQREER